MMRSLIDGDAIVTRRRRSRLRVTASLAVVLISALVGATLTMSARPCECYPASGDQDTFPGQVGPPYQLAARPAARDRVSMDDDEDNEIPRYRLGDDRQGAPLLRPREGEEGDEEEEEEAEGQQDNRREMVDVGELALARLLMARNKEAAPRTNFGEAYLLEDKDYPKSLFEDYAQRLGQVSGIATLPSDEVAIFHRANHHWDENTFNETSKQVPRDKRDDLIQADTIMLIDRDGGSLKSFGSNLFYMPHSVASDNQGNLWVSDVARHQVMRLPAINIQQANNSNPSSATHIWPDIILGEAFVSGQDDHHFCQPSEIEVSSNGQLVYVADGYCNQRVMVFSGSSGKLIGSFGQAEDIRVAHSLALIEEKNLLCVADRENHRILCYNAGLDGELAHLGELIHKIDYPIGRVFAIASISPDHLLVSSNQVDTNRYDLAILNPFTHELKLVWVSSDLLEPHSLATTFDRQYAYAADLSRDAFKKVFKFHVIQRKN